MKYGFRLDLDPARISGTTTRQQWGAIACWLRLARRVIAAEIYRS